MQWLYDNAEDDDVIIEAPGCSYQVNGGIPTSGMAAMTGVPTIIGWGGHESQWRAGQPELLGQIGMRQGDVAAIYADPSSPLVDQYGATLLFVGSYERYGAPSCDLRRTLSLGRQSRLPRSRLGTGLHQRRNGDLPAS